MGPVAKFERSQFHLLCGSADETMIVRAAVSAGTGMISCAPPLGEHGGGCCTRWQSGGRELTLGLFQLLELLLYIITLKYI